MNNDLASWLVLGKELSEFAEKTLYELSVDSDSGVRVFSSLLFRRTTFGLKAIVLLTEHGLFTEASIQRRGTLEALFILRALRNQPEIVPDLVNNDTQRLIKLYSNLKKTSKKFRQRHLPEFTDLVIDEKLQDLNSQRKSPYLSTESLSQKAGLYDLYLSDYCILSEIAHHKTKDLEKHVDVDGSGKIKSFSVEADETSASSFLYPALDQGVLACAAINDIFSLGLETKLSTFLRRIDELR